MRDQAIAALAARQHGVVSWEQLRRIGLDENAVLRRVERGILVRLHRGVYAFGHAHLRMEGRWLAAVLALGEDAALSHRSAARHLGLTSRGGVVPEVTGPRSLRPRDGIVVHRSRRWAPEDRFVFEGIPTTTPSRTLTDFADVASQRELQRAAQAAERLRLHAPIVPVNGRRGTRKLQRLEAAHRHHTNSELEERFVELVQDHGLPAPSLNATVDGVVDAVWDHERLVVELDGEAFHSTPADRAEDRRRDRRLTLAGWRVLRYGWADVTAGAAATAAELRAALSRRSG